MERSITLEEQDRCASYARLRALLAPFRFRHMVRRNFLMWRKTVSFALVGNVLEPLILLGGLGIGIGTFLPEVDGMTYASFLAAGVICSNVMNAASVEAMQSVFIRWKVRRTWDTVLGTAMGPTDVVLGELIWAALRATLSGAIMFALLGLFGLIQSLSALWILPLLFLYGLAMSAVALIAVAYISAAELQTYYFALFLLPMTIVSGVYFSAHDLPEWVQAIARVLPLYHATTLTRGLLTGTHLDGALLSVTVIVGYAATGAVIAARVIGARVNQ